MWDRNISPEGQKFMQGRGSAESLRDISDPEGKIFLSYMNKRVVDLFSPTKNDIYGKN